MHSVFTFQDVLCFHEMSSVLAYQNCDMFSPFKIVLCSHLSKLRYVLTLQNVLCFNVLKCTLLSSYKKCSCVTFQIVLYSDLSKCALFPQNVICFHLSNYVLYYSDLSIWLVWKLKYQNQQCHLSWVLIVQLCTLFTVEWNPAKILILTTNLDICLYCNNFLLQRECYPEWFCNKYIFYYKINESQLMDSCRHLTFHFICWVYLYLQFIFFRDLFLITILQKVPSIR